MSDNQKPPLVMLGEMYSDIKWLREKAEAAESVSNNHESRLTELEQFKFKLVWVVGAVGTTVGLMFSSVKEGAEWLMNRLT